MKTKDLELIGQLAGQVYEGTELNINNLEQNGFGAKESKHNLQTNTEVISRVLWDEDGCHDDS